MSAATESPVQSSSSSDDFAALLDAELEVEFSDSSVDCELATKDDEDNIVHQQRKKRVKLDSDDVEDLQASIVIEMLQEKNEESGKNGNKNTCSHPGFFKGMCLMCGKLEESDGSGVAFGYIHKDLRLGSSEVERLRGADLKDLMGKKKLILILDLDHTLLNSTRLSDITPEEEYLLQQAESNKDDPNRSLFKLESMHMLTKLRPFVRKFLMEASSNFEMYVYTMAEKSYALEMANILDPGKVYFPSKVISQADCTQPHQKGLDVVLGAESMAVILDDTEFVWQRHKENLIEMERYHFFAHSSQQFGTNSKSLSQLMKDERESDGVLATILAVLKRTHQSFFEPTVGADLPSRDVRQVLKNIKKEILQGCKIVFTRVFPSRKVVPQDEPIWRKAERLGAVCCTELDSSVTHVVSKDAGTEKSRWALQNEKFLVNPAGTEKSRWALQNEKFLVNPHWIEGAHFLWRRQREEDFPVGNAKKKQ